jgi:hypothetical protein
MAIITATEVTVYTTITASAGTIVSKGIIPMIQERITLMTNNYFLTDLDVEGSVIFNATAGTIVSGTSFVDQNFLAGDDIFIYNSYRNDGYFTIGSVNDKTLTLATGCSVIAEKTDRDVLISVVRWPIAVKKIAAEMIAYDLDARQKRSAGIASHSLGPYSESFTSDDKEGYPRSIVDGLTMYTMARLM